MRVDKIKIKRMKNHNDFELSNVKCKFSGFVPDEVFVFSRITKNAGVAVLPAPDEIEESVEVTPEERAAYNALVKDMPLEEFGYWLNMYESRMQKGRVKNASA